MKSKLFIIISLVLLSLDCTAEFGFSTKVLSTKEILENSKEEYRKEASEAFRNNNYSKAIRLWEVINDANAWNSLGMLYELGLGVPQSYRTASEFYLRSARDGNANAMYNIANLYYCGNGVNKNYSEALKWYKKAAELNCAKAMYNLGCIYIKGKGVKKNKDEAINWYEKAATMGYADAVKALDILYENKYWIIF